MSRFKNGCMHWAGIKAGQGTKRSGDPEILEAANGARIETSEWLPTEAIFQRHNNITVHYRLAIRSRPYLHTFEYVSKTGNMCAELCLNKFFNQGIAV